MPVGAEVLELTKLTCGSIRQHALKHVHVVHYTYRKHVDLLSSEHAYIYGTVHAKIAYRVYIYI